MNADQRTAFHRFAERLSRRATTGSSILDGAIIAASRELELLGVQRDELLVVCKALVEPPLASGFFDDSMNWTCGYCNAYADDHTSIEHRHDCEIQLGRALIAKISSLGDE